MTQMWLKKGAQDPATQMGPAQPFWRAELGSLHYRFFFTSSKQLEAIHSNQTPNQRVSYMASIVCNMKSRGRCLRQPWCGRAAATGPDRPYKYWYRALSGLVIGMSSEHTELNARWLVGHSMSDGLCIDCGLGSEAPAANRQLKWVLGSGNTVLHVCCWWLAPVWTWHCSFVPYHGASIYSPELRHCALRSGRTWAKIWCVASYSIGWLSSLVLSVSNTTNETLDKSKNCLTEVL